MSRFKIIVMPLGVPMMSYEYHYCLAYYHKFSMTSSKCRYLHTHIIEKVERVKMSDYKEMYSDEEERMVTQVRGRVRSLV